MCSEWLPIETAPEGANVLLFFPLEHDGEYEVLVESLPLLKCFKMPTHWMPLPPPPVPEQ